jgi:steroid delta-isomerase-like uncharacterized protein
MTPGDNEKAVRQFIERGFNQGDLSVVDETCAVDGVDHQEPQGTDYRQHLKAVIGEMRAAFPDLHFEIHQMMSEGDTAAFRSTMTGTHQGAFRGAPPSGKKISVAHMHFVRFDENGQSRDLWHVWDMLGMLRQLGAVPVPQR